MGRPLFEPTNDRRNTVQAMTGLGFSQEAICVIMEIDGKTLRKHFRQELDQGKITSSLQVRRKAFELAIAGNIPMLKYWLGKFEDEENIEAMKALAEDAGDDAPNYHVDGLLTARVEYPELTEVQLLQIDAIMNEGSSNVGTRPIETAEPETSGIQTWDQIQSA